MTETLAVFSKRTTAFLRLIRFSQHVVRAAVRDHRSPSRVSAQGGFGMIPWTTGPLILVCMVTARTAAMAFNRYADRRFDALNPRTASRPSVTGEVLRARWCSSRSEHRRCSSRRRTR
jgi:4-hydroxybenzoate polyprenyltransferase